jgi:hypothetical protein
MIPMRIVLREISTHLLYVGFNSWTYEPETAKNFNSIEDAEGRAPPELLRELEVVLLFDDPRCELAVPLRGLKLNVKD